MRHVATVDHLADPREVMRKELARAHQPVLQPLL